MSHRKGLLKSFKKNGSKGLKSSAAATTTSSIRATRTVRAPSSSRSSSLSDTSSRTMTAPSRAQLLLSNSTVDQSTPPPSSSSTNSGTLATSCSTASRETTTPTSSKRDQPHRFRYYEQAQQYEDRLSKSWDPLPGIRLFLDGEVVTNELRSTAQDESESGKLCIWKNNQKFYKVNDHTKLFPVLCQYLKTWSRRRSSPKEQNEVVITGIPKNNALSSSSSPTPDQPNLKIKKEKNSNSPKLNNAKNTANSQQIEVQKPSPETPIISSQSQTMQHIFEVQPPEKSYAIPHGYIHSSPYLDAPVVAFLKKSKTWYKGKIWYINLNGTFDVLFDDGDRRTCLSAPLVRWFPTLNDNNNVSVSIPIKTPLPATSVLSNAKNETYNVGDDVRVRFRDGWKYFPGKITNVHKNALTYDVKYDDNEIELNVSKSMLCKLSKHDISSEKNNRLGLTKGTFVEAKYNKGKQWYRGNLRGCSSKEMEDGMYLIEYEDGDTEYLKRRHLWVVRKTSVEGRKEFGQLVPGQKIKARYGKGIEWYDGKIIQKQEGTNSYDIVYSDGDKELGVPRWLIVEKPNVIVVEGDFLWKSTIPITYDNGQDYVLQMYEIEGSTEIYLFVKDENRKVNDNGDGEALARLSVSDDDVIKILEAGGVTEEQINQLESPQDLCEAVADLIEIKGGVEEQFSLVIKT
jgi:hypothetical protein